MDIIKQELEHFIATFLEKEADAWTKSELGDVGKFNKTVQELYAMGTANMDEAFGILTVEILVPDEEPMSYKIRHLYKLSHYKNGTYGDIWVAYVSGKNPRGLAKKRGLFEGVIICEIENELKIIGTMIIAMDDMTMETTGWESSVYNPEDLDIRNLGEFIATTRYTEPKDDGFSMADYLADK